MLSPEQDKVIVSTNPGEFIHSSEKIIVGTDLLDRIEADTKDRIRRRNILAMIERISIEGTGHILIYDDLGYALVEPDGSVSGIGSIRTEIENVVVLCSMSSYDVPELLNGNFLPKISSTYKPANQIGNKLLQTLSFSFFIIGFILLISPIFINFYASSATILTTISGLGFILTSLFIITLVIHSRLSDRFRSSEYQNRLKNIGIGSNSRPSFIPQFEEK